MDNERPKDVYLKCDVCGVNEGLMWRNPEYKGHPDPEWLCAKHMIDTLEKQVDKGRRMLNIQKQDNEPTFPISTSQNDYNKPHPLLIPWSVAEMAYSVYARKFGKDQSMQRLAERGGFGPGEMDEFYPEWIEASSEISKLRNFIIDAREDLVDRDQENYILKSQLRVLGQQFDDLAQAVGWNKERCNQTGDSPFDVARDLLRDVTELKTQLEREKTMLDVAVRKIAELSPEKE